MSGGWFYKTIILAACVAVLAGCGPSTQDKKRQAQATHQMGIANMRDGQYAHALRQLTTASQFDPTDPEIYNSLGLAYWRLQEYRAAETNFRKAVEFRPEYSEAWNNLGAMLISSKRYHDSIPPLEKALDNVFYKTPELALANMGFALYKVGRLSEARTRLEDGVRRAPRFFLTRKFLGMVLQEMGDHKGASIQFEEAVRTFPDDAETRLKWGLSLLKLKDYEGAKREFKEAWRLGAKTELGESAKTYLELLE